jgi:hypothetical protein
VLFDLRVSPAVWSFDLDVAGLGAPLLPTWMDGKLWLYRSGTDVVTPLVPQ